MSDNSQVLSTALFVSGAMLILFLIGREVVCWYWKINKSVQLLEEILKELKQSNGKFPK